MSAVLVLAFLFALIGFIFSPMGLFVLLIGLLGFLALPVVPRIVGHFHGLATLHHWLATSILQRAAIVVSEHGDLLLKRMSFDDLGVEKMQFSDGEKEFEDPDSALHHWLGIPFALADERHGVLFDPRHCALGARKRAAEARGEFAVRATDSEWHEFDVSGWVRGVFEFPEGEHELVDLSAVRQLVDGGERAEYPESVETIYEHSREPFKTGVSTTDWLMIIVALLAPFGMLWLLASQGGGGGGPTDSVGYGIVPGAMLLAAKAGSDDPPRMDWRRAMAALAVGLPIPLGLLVLAIVAGPIFALLVAMTLALGFLMIPALAFLLRPSTRLSVALARLLLKLGFLAYDRPVFEWTPQRYRLREFRDLDHTGDVSWYGLAGTVVGFTFEPSPESWGAEVVDRAALESQCEPLPDGGVPEDSNIPSGFTRVPEMRRASLYAAFVPQDLKRFKYYLHTGIATGRFSDSAVGEKSLNRLLYAKEKHGGEGGMSDRSMLYAMAGCGAVSFFMGVFVFFL